MIKKLPKIIIILLLFFLFFPSFSFNNVFAYSLYFEDDFEGNNIDINKWNKNPNSGDIIVNNSRVQLSSSGASFPYLSTKPIVFPQDKDFYFSVKYKYNNVSCWGTGIKITDLLPINGSSPPPTSRHLVDIWQDCNTPLALGSSFCTGSNPSCDINSRFYVASSSDTSIHTLKIIYKYASKKFEVFLDNNKKFSSTAADFTPQYIWLGHPKFMNHNDTWTGFEVYNISISDPQVPIVLIPGLGASWNLAAVTSGVPLGPWGITPFVKVYENFKNTLLGSGFEKGKNYFEFYYNWMQPVDNMALDFKNYLENTVFPIVGEQKIRLVGHSLGGLVARTYANKYGLEKIDKIATVGTPHKGALSSYFAWEGGIAGDDLSWSSLGFEFLILLNRDKFQSLSGCVHEIAPSLKDLLPIFDFLKNHDGSIIPFNSMVEKNNFLMSMSDTEELKHKLVALYGEENNSQEDSIEYYHVQERNILQKLTNVWVDGFPVGLDFTKDGDLTVLTKSATMSGIIANKNLSGDHREIIEKSENIKAILEALELEWIEPEGITQSYPRNPSLFFFLQSPARLKVTTPEGEAGDGVVAPLERAIYSPENNLLVIPQALGGNYNVSLNATTNANYSLYIGQLTEKATKWENISGEIKENETKNYPIEFTPEDPKDDPIIDETGKIGLETVRSKINDLLNFADSQKIFFFRKLKIKSDLKKIINLISKAQSQESQNKFFDASNSIKKALQSIHNLRFTLINFKKNNFISDETFNYLTNNLEETETELIKNYLLLFEKSGHLLYPKTSQKEKNEAVKIFEKFEKQINNNMNNSPFLGNTFLKAKEYLDKAKNSGKNPEIYIYSLISKLYGQEGLRFITR